MVFEPKPANVMSLATEGLAQAELPANPLFYLQAYSESLGFCSVFAFLKWILDSWLCQSWTFKLTTSDFKFDSGNLQWMLFAGVVGGGQLLLESWSPEMCLKCIFMTKCPNCYGLLVPERFNKSYCYTVIPNDFGSQDFRFKFCAGEVKVGRCKAQQDQLN